MNNKLILAVLFAATFSMFISFNHPAYGGATGFTGPIGITGLPICNANSHDIGGTSVKAKDGFPIVCSCDPGFVQNGFGGNFDQPVCIPAPVGGMGIPIDSTALLLAGIQGSALWMIPGIVVTGAGIGIFSFKRSKTHNKK